MNNNIVANVGGNAVYAQEIDEMVAAYAQRGQNYDTPQGRAALLEQVINKKLLLLDAKKNLLEHNPQFKAELDKIKDEMLANFNVQKVIENITVTDDEAQTFFNENKDQFQKGEAVSASHILVDSEDKANEIKEKIESGEIGFEDAASSSSCATSTLACGPCRGSGRKRPSPCPKTPFPPTRACRYPAGSSCLSARPTGTRRSRRARSTPADAA